MSKRKDADLIQDIKECIARIISYTKDMEYDVFENDFKTQDAVIRNVEIIGEATKLLSSNLKSNFFRYSLGRHCWNKGQTYPRLFWCKY